MAQITRSERLQALLFLLIGLVVTASVILVLVGLPFVRDEKIYYLEFRESVGGLVVRAPVRYKGIKYGEVREIRVKPSDPEVIRVTLALEPDAPITVSTTARISTDTILGPYHIELVGSRASSPHLPEDSYIPAEASRLARLIARGDTVGEQLVVLLANLQSWTGPEREKLFWETVQELRTTITTTRKAIARLEPAWTGTAKVYSDLGKELQGTLKTWKPEVERLLASLNASTKRVDEFLAGGALERVAEKVEVSLERAVTELENDGKAVRDWIGAHDLKPYLERVTAAVERLEGQAAAAGDSVSKEAIATLRDGVVPTLATLNETAVVFRRLLLLIERQPNSLLFGADRPEKKLPGGRQ